MAIQYSREGETSLEEKAYELADKILQEDSSNHDSREQLKKAILAVVNGEDYIQPSLIPVLNSKMLDRDSDSSKIESLTRRELEVLKMLSYGTYNKEIAEHLNISERTVKNHVSNIFKKIDVSDRTQAAVFAIKNDLIKLY